MEPTVEVLVAGAGPTGLTAAIELARRGLAVRVIDRSPTYAIGSRGDGLQPRSMEVFEDLGVLDELLASGMGAPLNRVYAGGEVVWEARMADPVEPRPDVPYPNVWFVPQARTEEILRGRLAGLGVRVELATELVDFDQDQTGVTATLAADGATEQVRARYLVGADGGRSAIRKRLGIGFLGETDESTRVLLADVRADGLDHEFGHAWTRGDEANREFFGFTPLTGGENTYVVATPLTPDAEPELTLDYLQRRLDAFSGRTDIRLHELGWITVWRPNVRMAERFRSGRVFLAGDAAHVHPPTGGQGLNTGVQDAYNLAWKLATVLGGAPVELLDSYEDERLPVAAQVLGVSSKLLKKYADGDEDANKRGAETQQLGLTYRDGPLASDERTMPGELRAGDRAPDAPCRDADDEPVRLFDLFAGGHATLLAFGVDISVRRAGLVVRTVSAAEASAPASEALVDADGHAQKAYDVAAGTFVLVRPDGYVGTITADVDALCSYLDAVLPVDQTA